MLYLVSNPRSLTAKDIDTFTCQVFRRFEDSRKGLFEVHEQTVLKLVYDLLELKFSISVAELERIIWFESSEVEPVCHARELIRALNEMQVPTAVISNLDFSGYLLRERLDQLFPDNRFRFVIASSDYGIRKPDPLIFRAGIAKSGLAAEDIWYVGDKLKVDAVGCQNAGMIPVLYKNRRNTYEDLPEGLLVIDDLLELLDIIPS